MIETAVLESMSDGSRTFQTGKGSFAAFSVKFADGRTGEVTTKSDTLDKRRQEYQGLIGKPAEFEFIDQGAWPDNSPKPWKIKRPQQGGGGSGGGGGQAAFRNTQEGQAYEQEAMDRRTALMQAVALGTDIARANEVPLLDLADRMYSWLRATKSSGEPSAKPSPAPPPSSIAPVEGQSPDPSKYQGTPTAPSGDEAHRSSGAPTHGEGTSPETVQESGGHVNGEVANTPAPGAVTELGADGAKALAAALGGQKFALDLARDQYGPDVTSLRKLTMAQGSELLEIAGKL